MLVICVVFAFNHVWTFLGYSFYYGIEEVLKVHFK